MMTAIRDMSEKFHEHLDKCSQCANNPFNLCAEGQRIMQSVLAAPVKP